MTIAGPATDALVSEYVIRLSETVNVHEAAGPTWDRQAELEGVSAQIAELTQAWKGKAISGARFFALLPDLEATEKALTAERGKTLAAAARAAAAARDLRAEWGSVDMAQRREFVTRFLSAVVVNKASRPMGKVYDPDRVVPVPLERA